MQSLKKIGALLLISSLALTSCNKNDDAPAPAPQPGPTATVVGIAQSDSNFSILVAAVQKAGLVNTLSNPAANFTVFAPTNAAFRSIGLTAASINALTSQTDINNLASILTYHVVGARVASNVVPDTDSVKTVNGRNIFASRNSNGVFVNGNRVSTADLNATNGIVHVIGSVLIPPTRSIAQVVIASASAPQPEFSLLLAAVQRAGLAGVLSGSGKYTVFAPTNAAFVAAGAPFNTTAGIAAADSATVRRIVLAHVVPTNVYAGDIIVGSIAPTANSVAGGTQQTLTLTGATALRLTASTNPSSNVITNPAGLFNITTTNGVIHAIDRVLL
jgi:uncharacterized surface protein with fasciclin (FAS1) repeats